MTARELVVAVGLLAVATISLAGPELIIVAPPGLEATVEKVEAIARGDFSSGLMITGLRDFGGPIQVVLAPEDAPIAQETPSWVSGYARGDKSVIVLFPARVRSYPDRNLQTLVHHEVAHVLVARAARGRPVPRWFNEGVATVAARQWGIEDRARFAMAVLGERPRSVVVLDAWFRDGGRQAAPAYAMSSAFVRFLQQRYGSMTAARILDGLAHDRTFEEAFLNTTGESLWQAEKIFFKKEVFWNIWVPFLSSSGGLWMGITLLALVAIKRRRARSAEMRARWDEEDEQVVLPFDRPEEPMEDDTVN